MVVGVTGFVEVGLNVGVLDGSSVRTGLTRVGCVVDCEGSGVAGVTVIEAGIEGSRITPEFSVLGLVGSGVVEAGSDVGASFGRLAVRDEVGGSVEDSVEGRGD